MEQDRPASLTRDVRVCFHIGIGGLAALLVSRTADTGGIRCAMIATGFGLALCGSGLRIGVEALASLDAELARIDIVLQ
jgi:hypothetical protein